jgi:type VI secretion system protein ImpA
MKKGKSTTGIKEYLTALSAEEPCGPNLEYDPEYVALLTRMIPRGDTQLGDFIKAPEEPNWGEIERECRQMLSRSRDITILLLLLRCRIHVAQASGVREVLEILIGWLERYPDHVHPQLTIDGEYDPTVRANALLALIDPEGVLGDLREVVLVKSSAMRLGIRDVERAFAIPRLSDALAPDSVYRQLNDLVHAGDANVLALIDSARLAHRLRDWLLAHMRENVSDLDVFFRLLGYFYREDSEPFGVHREQRKSSVEAESSFSSGQEAETEDSTEDENQSVSGSLPLAEGTSVSLPPMKVSPGAAREQAMQTIRSVREWFEQYEPSSPVPVLLRQAERLIGRKFSEVAQEIPIDLLERWSSGD